MWPMEVADAHAATLSRQLRRKLPINGQKFAWDKLQVHNLAANLQSR
jgi:hypothetical protein